MTLSWTYRITQYDPADRDESGCYTGDVEAKSDEGPLEAAYLDAVEAFARELGVTHLEVRDPNGWNPESPAGDREAIDPAVAGAFGEGLAGYFDGAVVDITTSRVLVRGMLREGELPGWCRLEAPDMTVHVGWDVYMYITTSRPCPEAGSRTAAAGLFPERWPGSSSPWAPEEGEEVWRSMHTPIDDAFWAHVDTLVRDHGAVLLEEVGAWTIWHRISPGVPRPGLRPRCRVWVWPDLTTDLADALSHLDNDDPDDIDGSIVWQATTGVVHQIELSGDEVDETRLLLIDAARAEWRSGLLDDLHPLLEAVMPDDDGLIRARWEPLELMRSR